MTYLPVAIFGYFLNAFATLIDKALLDKNIPNPIVYTFYLGVLSGLAILLTPFGFRSPTTPALLYSILAGFTFVFGWLTLYIILKRDEASRVSPIIGSFSPVLTLILGILFFNQILTHSQLIAFIILTIGFMIISSTTWFKNKLELENVLLMAVSGLFFALSSIFLRQAFLNSNFITVLVTSRAAMTFLVLTFVLIPKYRRQIFASRVTKHHLVNSTSKLLILGQIAGALGGLMLTFAISLANPAIVNATQGVQYIVILVIILLASKKYQKLLDEDLNKKTFAQKILGAIIISLGLGVLALG